MPMNLGGGGSSKPKLPPAPKPKSVGAGAVAGIRSVAPPPPAAPSSAVAAVAKAAGKGSAAVARTTSHASRTAGRATSTAARKTAKAGTKAGQTASYTAYRQAVIDVFNHQSESGQNAILKGVQASPNLFESKIISAYLKGQPFGVSPSRIKGASIADVHSLGTSVGDIANTAENYLTGAGKKVSGLINSIPTFQTSGQQLSEAAGLPVGDRIGLNAAKDAFNLPAEAGPSATIPIEEALHGHWGAAVNTFVKPVVNVLEHPGQAFTEHPLNSYLILSGLAHPVASVAEGGVRGVLGKPLNRVPESVHLTGKLTHERPLKSRSILTRKVGPIPGLPFGQDAIEYRTYKRNEQGQLVPRNENTRERLTKIETSRIVGQNERGRVIGHQEEAAAHADAFIRGRLNPAKVSSTAGARRVERTMHATKTALRVDPKAPLIKGSEVAGLAARRILRRPETAVADFEKYLKVVESSRHELVNHPDSVKLLEIHDETVAKLRAALPAVKKMKPEDWKRLFGVTDRYRREYKPLERMARRFGHYRDMTPEAMTRRELMDATLLHMPGARHDPELGMVRDLANGDVHKLSTDRMEQFVREQTGGHMPAYVPNRTLEGDRAHYVSQQSRPYPINKEPNTGFALLHGLVEPSHEALLENRVRLRGIIDSHKGNNRIDQQLVVTRPGNKPWDSFNEAKAAAPDGYRPIRLAKQFHPQSSLDDAIKGVDFTSLIEEADRRSLNASARMREPDDPNAKGGAWGLIDEHAAKQLLNHEKIISPPPPFRGIKGLNSQFRQVALATSFRHLPGVAQELLIRSAASGVGPISWFAGRAVLRRMRELNPELARDRAIQLHGGTVTGQALSLRTHRVAAPYEGTMLHGPLNAWDKAMRAPALRQAGYLWRAWKHFTLDGTKRFLEEQSQTAAIGKQTIEEFGGRRGLVSVAMGDWGKMVDGAAHGLFDEAAARRFRANMNRIYGRWTDLTPGEQGALMFSPFGMWWTNSVAWIARLPIDHPVLTGAMAAANTGTEKQRIKLGLDLFAPGALPLYKQGGMPIGGSLWQGNYYSPFGVANDPLGTAESLIQPWAGPVAFAAVGDNWHGGPISSAPGQGYGTVGNSVVVILASVGASFIPLVQKATTIASGGASSYDTSNLITGIQTKGPNPGLLKGLEKAVMPIRLGAATSGGAKSSGAVSLTQSSGGGVDLSQSLGGVDLGQSLK